MNQVLKLFSQANTVKKYLKAQKQNSNLLVTNTTDNHNCLLAALTFLDRQKTIFYIASNVYKATFVYETLCELISSENLHFYAIDEVVATEALAISNEFKFERLHTLCSLVNNHPKIIVTHVTAAARYIMDKAVYQKNSFILKTGDFIETNSFLEKLVQIGYKKAPTTSQVGTFSVRGEIIDIFPINNLKPIRLDFFDTEIESIKTYDPETQRTMEIIDEALIFPISELIYQYNENDFKSIPGQDQDDLRNYHNSDRMLKYLDYITDKKSTLLEYNKDSIVMFDEYLKIKENYQKTLEELTYYWESKKEYHQLKLSFFAPLTELLLFEYHKVYLSLYQQSLNDIFLDQIIALEGVSIIDYCNEIKYLLEDLKINKKTFVFLFSKQNSLNVFIENLNVNSIKYQFCSTIDEIKEMEINILVSQEIISFGFLSGLTVIDETHIFKRAKFQKAKYRSAYQNTKPISSKEDLSVGDYIVHYDYGIGQYLGIKTVQLKDTINVYIMLLFANMELYIPVEKINLIEKYLGSEGSIPKLTAIGTKEWEKKKSRIQEKMEHIARDLISLQAMRENQNGFLYQKDDEMQQSFEGDFEYILTKDQIQSVNDIKKDMEKGIIIDRLICGDVGYGKTEVAIRIAMKTVVNGKQVAYLAPTTILSRQHFYTFKQRFEKYGIKVALLNRLIDAKTQFKTLCELQEGKVDIIIGTHSLLNDNIQYKDLGLLIIDEEQRFGVLHKEKIKQYKNNINVITLTATPIPRTLQMAIMGVRQLSLIETPPQNRYPIQTYVLEENDIILREAIYRELGRGGQVFYLHNRISDLDKVYRKLHNLVKEARIIKAHGQMKKEELEDAIQSFIDKEYDILLCTTIIETGIDIPNTNTLIVDMSDRLGLAQMYQIRGRVGRSDRVSYAYFMYDKNMVLQDKSAKRLEAIKEFTVLGSGYKIAVRDLAIRGAGDILGKEQSGFIDTIGLDLYMKMLSEAIDKVKGKETTATENLNYNIEISKHVSNQYVSDDDIKIYIHKQIYQISSREQKEAVIEELTDRFGQLTAEIKLYIDKQYMEGLMKKAGIEKFAEENQSIFLTFFKEISAKIDGKKLFQTAYKISNDFFFEYKSHRIILKLMKRGNNKNWIYQLIELFEQI